MPEFLSDLRLVEMRHLFYMFGGDLAPLSNRATIFAGNTEAKLARLRSELVPLATRYDVVVAIPPYMGGSNMNRWLNAWAKKNYKETCRDLCTCFVRRGMGLARAGGYEALITSDTCMYIASFEKMRKMVIDETTIVAFIDTRGTNAHPDVFDANAGWVLWLGRADGMKGAYFKLSQPIAEKEARYLEALADPGCGWFYRRDASAFEAIPGSPIAYWARDSLMRAFEGGTSLRTIGRTSKGLITGDNNSFLRLWWECGLSYTSFKESSYEATYGNATRWFACTKGGPFRKWAGNLEWVVDWRENGGVVRAAAILNGHHCQDYDNELKFASSVTWTDISSSVASFRIATGMLSEHAGMCDFIPEDQVDYVLAFLNSSIAKDALALIAPTMHFNAGDIDSLPLIYNDRICGNIALIVGNAVTTSERDWNNAETAWGFCKHPLV